MALIDDEAVDEQATPASPAAQFAGRAILVLGVVSIAVGLTLLLMFQTKGPFQAFLLVGALLMVIYGFFEPEAVQAFVTQGQLQSGARAVLQAALVIAAVVILNLVVKDRLSDKTLDLSKGHVNTLAAQTIQLIDQVKQPLTVTVWYTQSPSEVATTVGLLRRYHDLNSNIRVQSYGLVDHPTLAQQQHISQGNSVVFEFSGRSPEVTTESTEQAIDTTLLRLISGGTRKAYFLQGHGEGVTDASTTTSRTYAALKDALTKQGVVVQSLNLLTGGTAAPSPTPSAAGSPAPAASPSDSSSPAPAASPSPSDTSSPAASPAVSPAASPAASPAVSPAATPSAPAVPTSPLSSKIPTDADEIVILDPTSPLAPDELTALAGYVGRGGHLLVSSSPFANNNLNDLTSPFGLKFGGGVVLDQQLQFNQTTTAGVLLIDTYGSSPVTRGLDTSPSVLVDVTPIEGSAAKGFTLNPLIQSAADACERTDKSIQAGDCQAADKKGTFTLFATLEQSNAKVGTKPARLVLIGGSQFATDTVVSQIKPPGNLPLLVNAINWLAGQDKIINIPPRDTTPDAVFMSAGQQALLFPGFVILLPLLVGLLGISVYLRRR